MLDEAKDFGIGVYNAWTIEPLLRPDLPRILRHAKELGFVTSLITNGHFLRGRAHELTNLDFLSVSVDAISSYGDIRGGDIQEVLDGIKTAKFEGHDVLINCVICGKNLQELEKLVNLAESLAVWISFEPVNESEEIDGRIWDEMGIRDLPAYQNSVDKLIELKRNGAPIINSLTYLNMIKTLDPKFRCHASDIIMHVTSEGIIQNCRVVKENLGNVSDGVTKVWNASQYRRQEITDNCYGCLFFGYVENSLLYELVPEVIAHYKWV
ncbi:MAG: radical SAM protein, partial [Methanotrichaceae archaeon]|nr:radical SAM protein [Methanotrichaceae archaeon]